MDVLVWLTETTWRQCVDEARRIAPEDSTITFLFVTDDEVAAVAHGAFAGLLGRSHLPDPAVSADAWSTAIADDILVEAEHRLGRPAGRTLRHGRIEREVVEAARGMDLLICARDGELSRVGPNSLGHHTRFVVDHADCPVLLVWPRAPSSSELPPPPRHPKHGHRRGHQPGQHVPSPPEPPSDGPP